MAEIHGALTRLASPALRTNLDMGNYPNHGQNVVAAIDTLADKIIAAHLKDKTANPSDPPIHLGAGVLPLANILAALDRLPSEFTTFRISRRRRSGGGNQEQPCLSEAMVE